MVLPQQVEGTVIQRGVTTFGRLNTALKSFLAAGYGLLAEYLLITGVLAIHLVALKNPAPGCGTATFKRYMQDGIRLFLQSELFLSAH
jgi:hypothetical protein